MKNALLATTGAVALLLPTAAVAQVDEIVVTATKREQTLQEVPVAVSVVQEDTIENAQIIDIFDLQSVVPSLRVSQNQSSGNTTFTIRGFGNGANNVGIEPSVGVFIDGVYRSRSASAISDLAEIERVEVLRGPQSTLFGKNASAGVISVVTQEPQFELQGKVEATYGNYDQKILKGYVTGPVTDTLALSLEGSINKRDGYAENTATGTGINDRDRWAIRGQALFEPTDAVSVRLIADYDAIEEICCYAAILVEGPTVPAVEALGADLDASRFYDYETSLNFDPENDIENRGISGQVDWDLGFAELTSITAYRQRRGKDNYDADFGTFDGLDFLAQINNVDTFTQELRISGATERVGWLAGLFYTNEDVSADSFISYGAQQNAYANLLSAGGLQATQDALIAAGVVPPGTVFQNTNEFAVTDFDQENEALSIFGQVDFDVTDRLTLTAGLSYTTDEKDVSLRDDNNFLFSSLNFVQIGFGQGFGAAAQQAVLAGLLDPAALANGITPEAIQAYAVATNGIDAFPTVQAIQAGAADPATNPLLALLPLQFLPANVDFPNAVETGKTEDDDVTYTLRAAYDVTDRLNAYVSYATGFKASSWNLTRDSRPFPGDVAALGAAGLLPNNTLAALGQYQGTRYAGPEESSVWEIGAKARFDWGALNVTLFDQTIDGFQSNLFQGTGFVLANAGEQNTQGIELELLASPTEWLDFNFAATLLDAKYEEFVGAPGPNGPTDLSGEEVAGVSDVNTSTAVTLKRPLSNGQAFARLEWQYESGTPTADNLPDSVEEREVSTFNASIGANLDNGLEALLWGRNLFNDEYLIVGFPGVAQAGSYYGYPNAPRTYGVTLRKRF